MESLRSDGKAVEVTLVATTEKGYPVYLDGFFGIAMQSGSSGDVVAIEIASREHEVTVGSGVSAAKGDMLYIANDGTISATDDGNTVPFMKVTKAKDENDVIWGILMPQERPLS
jgi:hypothetical protein